MISGRGRLEVRGALENIFSIDVEDWFHILDLPEAPPLAKWAALESRVERNFLRLLDVLEAGQVHATCFFLGWIAERFPELVRGAAQRGHEVASHGYGHQLAYTQSRAQFREDVRRTKSLLEQITGGAVRGYRAPGFSIVESNLWAFAELVEAGYEYDSSIFPAARAHGGLSGAVMRPHVLGTEAGDLLEFPMTVAEVLGKRMCFFGGGYFRLFPYWLIRRKAREVNGGGRPVIYYVHPREVDPGHPRIPMGALRRFKSYVNLDTTEAKLRALIEEQTLLPFEAWIGRHRSALGHAV